MNNNICQKFLFFFCGICFSNLLGVVFKQTGEESRTVKVTTKENIVPVKSQKSVAPPQTGTGEIDWDRPIFNLPNSKTHTAAEIVDALRTDPHLIANGIETVDEARCDKIFFFDNSNRDTSFLDLKILIETSDNGRLDISNQILTWSGFPRFQVYLDMTHPKVCKAIGITDWSSFSFDQIKFEHLCYSSGVFSSLERGVHRAQSVQGGVMIDVFLEDVELCQKLVRFMELGYAVKASKE